MARKYQDYCYIKELFKYFPVSVNGKMFKNIEEEADLDQVMSLVSHLKSTVQRRIMGLTDSLSQPKLQDTGAWSSWICFALFVCTVQRYH